MVHEPTLSSSLVEADQPSQPAENVVQTTERAQPDTAADASLDATSSTTSSEDLILGIEPRTEQQDWYRRKGFLPPLDANTLDAVRLVLGRKSALKMARLKADQPNFEYKLSTERNVHTTPDNESDSYIAELQKMHVKLPETSAAAADVYSRFWTADVKKLQGRKRSYIPTNGNDVLLRSAEIDFWSGSAFRRGQQIECDPNWSEACF